MTNMKEVNFPKPSYEEWKDASIKALKGKPFESLFTKTIEGITIEPLYTMEDLLNTLDGKLDAQANTVREMRSEGAFAIAQSTYADCIDEYISELKNSVLFGNQYLMIDQVSFEWSEEALKKLAGLLNDHPFFIRTADPEILNVFDFIENKEAKGFVLSNEHCQINGFQNVRKVSANIIDAHYKGANAVQELAIALAIASEQMEKVADFNQLENQFFAAFSIDTQFFMEIAKLRAFRILWKAFAKAYGIKNPKPVKIHAETSLRRFSKLDPYVNLLRAGNEAFAAAIGGADLLTVHPHNIITKPTSQSVRIARNVGLVIREESHVTKIEDPSGGAYYIESLTHDLAKEAWEKFVGIEAMGGYTQYVESGRLEKELEETMTKRLLEVETSKTILVGTNDFADANEEASVETFYKVQRLAEPFEGLRRNMKDAKVKAAILPFGDLKKIKPRIDFATGVLATAGMISNVIEPTSDIEKAKEWLKNSKEDYVIFCATDEDTLNAIPVLLEEKPASIILDVAGKFDTDWHTKGLNGYLYKGQNMIRKLKNIAETLKEVQR
ncbi:methylmalonyl-CoA mutase family protein [Rummeliibacillus stabekisii]|uniref:Methylmalonyl-CoA mutase n=1 Tax=Rummeliibacillus stabekisii TaxID=241244 RepID=A0A143HBJ1_9BACL|nr:methylmalonyl-CoA mutase family protein [Rummeliibacillus stabekisii]AMW98866.1 methylmalonyl-CoA mutase [Rummeliibacillus stabekisii]